MKMHRLSLILLGLLVASCSSTGGAPQDWTHAGLDAARQQQERDKCLEQAVAAEQAYYEQNSRGEANSASPFINNLKVRQRSMAARNESFDACMQAAGFARP